MLSLSLLLEHLFECVWLMSQVENTCCESKNKNHTLIGVSVGNSCQWGTRIQHSPLCMQCNSIPASMCVHHPTRFFVFMWKFFKVMEWSVSTFFLSLLFVVCRFCAAVMCKHKTYHIHRRSKYPWKEKNDKVEYLGIFFFQKSASHAQSWDFWRNPWKYNQEYAQ